MKFAAAVVVLYALSIHCYSLFAKMIQACSQKRKAAALVINKQKWSRGHKAEGQGHKKISRPRPRTDPLEAKDQGHRRKCSPKKSLQKFFSGKKGLQKIFLRRSLLEETMQIFGKVSGVFQQNFNRSKIVRFSSRGQGNFRGLEASRPMPRTSKCVLEDSTSVTNYTSSATNCARRL